MIDDWLGGCLDGYMDGYMSKGTGGYLNGYVDGRVNVQVVFMNWRLSGQMIGGLCE